MSQKKKKNIPGHPNNYNNININININISININLNFNISQVSLLLLIALTIRFIKQCESITFRNVKRKRGNDGLALSTRKGLWRAGNCYIQDLSEKFDETLREEVATNEHLKDKIWQAFIRKDGVKIDGSEEEVGVMRSLELGDTLALGYGIRKIVVQAALEKESENEATQSNDEIAQCDTSTNAPKPVVQNAIAPILQSTEPKEQSISSGNSSSFTKIADDPRGTQGSQRRLQSLLNAARAEADGFHTPNPAPHLQINEGSKTIEITGNSNFQSTDVSKVENRPHIQQHTAVSNSESLRLGPLGQPTDAKVTTNGPRREMDTEMPEVPPQILLSTSNRSTPKVGYQYQPALNDTRIQGAQLLNSPTENEADGIDYFSPDIPRHGPVPRQRKRGRPKGDRRQSITSSQANSFKLLKPPPKKRGRPKGPTIKNKASVDESRSDMNTEDTADAGLHITESGLRSSRRQPKPRHFFTPAQAASPEPETTTVKPGKSAAHTTPSKPSRRYREPVFISYEDLKREEDDQKRKAGIDGVYINPLDAREGRSLARKKTLVVLVKSQKLRNPDLLENRKGTWIEVLAEKRKVLHAMVEAEAAKIAAANSAAAAEEERNRKKERVRSEVPSVEIEKPPEALNAKSDKASANLTVGHANLQEVLNTEIAKPQVSHAESDNPLEVLESDPKKSSDVPNTGISKPSDIFSAGPAEKSKITGTQSDSFPSNEELASEFEKFKALSASNISEDLSTKTDSFPSNEELAREFEKFNAGFVQSSRHNFTTELSRPPRMTIDPFVANSMQYGQQAALVYPRAPASVANTQIPGPSSLYTAYMNSTRPRSPQHHSSHPVSQYGSPSRTSKPLTTLFQNETRSAATQQPQQPQWIGPPEQHRIPATEQNSLHPVSNIHSYSSPYRGQVEHNQTAGRHYQPTYHGHAHIIHTPSPGERYRSPYEGEQQATPSVLALNPWLVRDPAHVHKPVLQSPAQKPWPAGFLPPEPPERTKPQIPSKTEWPAGFLPPNALPSDTTPSSPMSTDSYRQFSPASVSHASDHSTMAHSSQETLSNRPTPYASPQPMSHPHISQPQSAVSVSPSSSSYPKSAISTTNQQQVLAGRQTSLGQVQISSPLSQQFNSIDTALRTRDAAPADNHINLPKPEIEPQAQASMEHSSKVSSLSTQRPVPIESVAAIQPENGLDQIQPTKPVEPQPDKTTSKTSIPAQTNKSPSVQPAPEPTSEPISVPELETKKRKRSTTSIQCTAVSQVLTAMSSNPAESTNVIIEKSQTHPPAATPDDVEAFKKAGAIQFEPFFARMSSIYNSVMGNLILSFDKTLLNFWSMAEGEADPIWTMQVWKMAENPIVSMPGSNPMELRLKEKKDDESIVVHRFLIARTKEAHKSANEMRANLVTARIFVQMANPQIVQAEDPEVIATKPWKCEKCGSRFKNKEGIKYHLSKSQTTCNPGFNPKSIKPRQNGWQKKETPKKEKVTETVVKTITAPEKEVQPEPTDQSVSESEGGDSDDSVFEWAAKVVALKKSPKNNRADRGDPVIGRNGKIVKSTPSLKDELANIPPLPQTPEQSLPEALLPMSKEKVVKDIILCLLRANNNALPGERGLWFAFVACWLKLYPTSKILPEHKLFSRALDELLEDETLSKTTFDFPGARSRTIVRSILSDPKLPAPSSADIAKLKDAVKNKASGFLYTPWVLPSKRLTSATQLNDILGSDAEEGHGDSSDDEFKPEVHALDAEDDLEDDPMDIDIDSDGSGSELSAFPDYISSQVLPFSSSNQQKPPKINGSQTMRPRMRYPGQTLSPEERERRKHTVAVQEQRWIPQQVMLQNPTNGAWDIPSKPKRTYKLRERLPEPATFMQDSSGSWSTRPFGHGVNPIFARPNKMTVGNPQGEQYLQQREDSHRPVIHPNKSVMRPSVPSKSQRDPEISRYTGIKKRGYRALTPDPMDLMEASVNALEDNDDLPPEQQTLIGPKRKRQQKKEPHIGVRKGLKNKWVMARRLTSAPDDLLGVHRDVRYAADLLGTQMVNYDTNIRRKRQRFKEQGLATDEEERLTMGIVIIRAMLGGLEMNIDWGHSRFYRGLSKGQVQSIDYDHIVDYDFNTLIDWSMSKINTPTVEEKVFDLPDSFSDLEDKYALVPEPRSNYWSEQYYYPLAAVYQRMNLVNSVPFTYPIQQEAPTYEIDDYALAKSWCRAAAVTPDHLWDSKAANKLLNRLPSTIIIKAREDLLKNKIITKNKRLRTNGRVYNIPDAFNAVFVRTGKVIYEKQYREAYDFKCELDRRFQNGETIVNIPWGVNEGSVLAITNLQANGCIYVSKEQHQGEQIRSYGRWI
ncbi:hypothetical protein DID88_005115 [Monilinia fructigena]|uniref:C2H2-type domain-containing protein n=1 Tax=Monilinia fructigena TaxID=38457 RepID=A0A395IDX9_9HELO|nr:hypothetical protein DID88_005115 [Monilinia fructigena]